MGLKIQIWELSEYIYIYLPVFIKDTNEQPGEEVHKARVGRVPIAEAPVPLELGYSAYNYLQPWLYDQTRGRGQTREQWQTLEGRKRRSRKGD